jgi:hypothetical protein
MFLARRFLHLPWSVFFNLGLLKLFLAGAISIGLMHSLHLQLPASSSVSELLLTLMSVFAVGALGYLLPFMFFSERLWVLGIMRQFSKKVLKTK